MPMPSPQDHCETPIELNDIRTALNKITDTELALDILTSLEKLENFTTKQANAIKTSSEEASRLQKINQALMVRATATNTGVQTALALPTSTQTGFSEIDPVQDIISRI